MQAIASPIPGPASAPRRRHTCCTVVCSPQQRPHGSDVAQGRQAMVCGHLVGVRLGSGCDGGVRARKAGVEAVPRRGAQARALCCIEVTLLLEVALQKGDGSFVAVNHTLRGTPC